MFFFCDIIFYSEICLRNNFCRKLNVHDECGECQMSCWQVFKYCSNCCEIVKQCDLINGGLYLHDCAKCYCSYCERYMKKPHFCFFKSVDVVKSATFCE